MNLNRVIGFAAGPIVSASLSLAIIPVIAWTFLPADVGRLNILQISMSFALLLSVLGLDQAYVREYYEVGDKEKLLITCFLPGFILLIFVGLVSAPFSQALASFMYGVPQSSLYIGTLLAFFISHISRFLALIFRMQERGWAYSLSQIFPKLVQLAIILIIFFSTFEKSFLNLQLTILLSLFFTLVISAWNTRAHWIAAASKKIMGCELRKALAFGFPLVFSGLAYWGLISSGALALRLFSSLEELAVYSVASSFAGAATIFQSIFSVIWAPVVYKRLSKDADMNIIDSVAKQILAAVCVIVAFCGSFSWMIDFILPENYEQVKYVVLCLMMQPLLYTLSEVTGMGINVQRKTVLLFLVTFGAMLVNFFSNILLVPLLGSKGAAISSAISFVVFFIAKTEVSSAIWRKYSRANTYSLVIFLLILVVLTCLFSYRSPVVWHCIWLLILVLFSYAFRSQGAEAVCYFERHK